MLKICLVYTILLILRFAAQCVQPLLNEGYLNKINNLNKIFTMIIIKRIFSIAHINNKNNATIFTDNCNRVFDLISKIRLFLSANFVKMSPL